MSLPKDIRQKPCLDEWCILCGYRGSIAHGMYRAPSDPNSIDDKDIMSVCVPPIEYYYGLFDFGSHGTKEIKQNEWDVVVYEARKFIRLLAQANPNVMSLLWLPNTGYITRRSAGDAIILNRTLFSTKRAYKSFVGYAHGQLHRMTHMTYKGYMGQKRKSLVKKFGFDVKNAAHLIRLLRMGIEFLATGELTVERPDAQQLLEIKAGEWTLEQVKKEADRLFVGIDQALIHCKLPDVPDMKRINRLCVDVVCLHMASRASGNTTS